MQSCVLVILAGCLSASAAPERIVQQVRYDSYKYGIPYNITINRLSEFIFSHSDTQNEVPNLPARVTVSSPLATHENPVFITARQQKGVRWWQLPLLTQGHIMSSFSRTLCPNRNIMITGEPHPIEPHIRDSPIVHFYTSSEKDVSITFTIDVVWDFYLPSALDRNITASPSEPPIFFYSFDGYVNDEVLRKSYDSSGPSIQESAAKDTNSTGGYFSMITNSRVGKSVSKKIGNKKMVLITLDSNDDTCMLISIQNASCPVFDDERNIFYDGYYATLSRRGGISVSQRRFPNGFYLVLLVKCQDVDCTGHPTNASLSNLKSFFSFNPQDYGSGPKSLYSSTERRKILRLRVHPSISVSQYWLAGGVALAALVTLAAMFLIGLACHHSHPITMDILPADERDAVIFEANNPGNNHEIRPGSETASTDTGMQQADVFLNQLCHKDVLTLNRKANMYVWHLLTVAVFYALPVIQLVITYQKVLNNTGNQDLCYYNFLCAHPVGSLSDFNHVYSNLGYIFLGALFLIFVWRRKQQHCDPTFDTYYGIPQHHGIYYAMGIALIMEGILSGSYHVCPNHSNFQFDTSFMYVIAVLCMVKIYQTRHPDIAARAHATFGVLTGSLVICLLGVLYPNIYFWIFFTMVHISTCFVLTLQIYYLGEWRDGVRGWADFSCRKTCQPTYKSRLILVVLANLCNCGLAAFGLWAHSKDFATHMLYIFLMNLALHLTFYITMKLTHGERPPWHVWLLLLLAVASWGGALYFFFDNSTSWALTPAQSRVYNKQCTLLSFFDYHDIWHFLSAASMFFSFMLLLTLDDDLTHTPRHNIPVF